MVDGLTGQIGVHALDVHLLSETEPGLVKIRRLRLAASHSADMEGRDRYVVPQTVQVSNAQCQGKSLSNRALKCSRANLFPITMSNFCIYLILHSSHSSQTQKSNAASWLAASNFARMRRKPARLW